MLRINNVVFVINIKLSITRLQQLSVIKFNIDGYWCFDKAYEMTLLTPLNLELIVKSIQLEKVNGSIDCIHVR